MKEAKKRNDDHSEQLKAKKDEIKKDFKDKISILAVSYHNLGVE
jgi:hypothetical protein